MPGVLLENKIRYASNKSVFDFMECLLPMLSLSVFLAIVIFDEVWQLTQLVQHLTRLIRLISHIVANKIV